MGNKKPSIIEGKLNFTQSKDGVAYVYLKTYELFDIEDFEFLNVRSKLFSRKIHIHAIGESDRFDEGDYVIHDNKLSKIIYKNATNDKLTLQVIMYISKNKHGEQVWDIVDGEFIFKTYATYLPEYKGYTRTSNTKFNIGGSKHELKEGKTLSTDKPHTYDLWTSYNLRKIWASTDKNLEVRRFKERQLKHIIHSNGTARRIKFSLVPNNYIKIKSQKTN